MNPIRLAAVCVLLTALPLAAGCGAGPGGSSAAGGQLAFHGELEPLAGFSYDSGYQPGSGPAQVKLAISTSGTLEVDAMAVATGDSGNVSMIGVAGSGKATLDVHFKVDPELKIDAAGVQFEGPIPMAPAIDLAFGATTTFDPFLLGQSATLTADVPETELGEIPFTGGKLIISASGTVRSEISGTCAAIGRTLPATAQYLTRVSTGGTVRFRVSIAVGAGFLSKTFGPFDIPPIDLPSVPVELDLGQPIATETGIAAGTPVTMTACLPGSGQDGGPPPDGTGGDGPALDGGRDLPVADLADVPTDGPAGCVPGAACTTSCGSSGTLDCSGGGEGVCQGDCGHEVICEVVTVLNQPGIPGDAIYVTHEQGSLPDVCVPDDTPDGRCEHVFRCRTLAAPDGHTHKVNFHVFDDGFSNAEGPDDVLSFNESTEACLSGATSRCGKWFGHAVTEEVNGHVHDVQCHVFDDGFTNVAGPSDSIFWNGEQLCVPDAGAGTCRRWFGHCFAR